MITFFILALAATALFFAAVPVVLGALMLETCEQRSAKVVVLPAEAAPHTHRARRAPRPRPNRNVVAPDRLTTA